MKLSTTVQFAFLSVIYSCLSVHATTDIYLKMVSHGQRITLGIQKFVPDEAEMREVELSRKIQDVIRQDLAFTRYFNISSENIFMWKSKKEKLEFLQKQIVDELLTGTIKVGKTIILKIEMIEVESGNVILRKFFQGSPDDYRSLAHEVSDEVVFSLTGERGIAHSKIVFVNNSTGNKEIYMIDYDGYNLKRITNDKTLNLFPKWTRNGKNIVYTTYKYGNPDLYIMNKDGKNRKAVSKFQGVNVTPSFSKDGNLMVLTLSKGRSPNLYIMDLSSKTLRQLTHSDSVDTSPCFSPDKQDIVFISDRAGRPQMYITDVEGINTRRILTDGYTDSPSWSPRGDKIAFTMQTTGKGAFDIYLYDIISEQVSRVTFEGDSNEAPSFSPDGRFITHTSKRGDEIGLYMMSIDGSFQRRLTDIKGDCYTPSWSP